MRILITGSNGFIGKNLRLRLSELQGYEVISFDRDGTLESLEVAVDKVDAIIHLASINRTNDPVEFDEVNAQLTAELCCCIKKTRRPISLIMASSIQALLDNPYGVSKLAAENHVRALAEEMENPVTIYRLPNVFGKWCKPNYNSVVSTFCNNIANDLPIQINDLSTELQLVYVDDVVAEFIAQINKKFNGMTWGKVEPVYRISLGNLAKQIEAFKTCRSSLVIEKVGVDFARALYATYLSYLPPKSFTYDLPQYIDERGIFVEILKTKDSGQFSFFTALPGVTRGGHYHHTKTEKFLVIKGRARFGFRHMLTGERYEVVTAGDKPQIVETVPGWTHDIANIGDDEMVVMLWANEIFDREHPDTIACKV